MYNQDPRSVTRRSDAGLSSLNSEKSYSEPRRRSYGNEPSTYSSDYKRCAEMDSRSYDRDPAQQDFPKKIPNDEPQYTSGNSKPLDKLSTTARAEQRAGAPAPSVQQTANELVDYQKAGDNMFAGARFIFEIGIKLEVHPITIATAANIFHKFWRVAARENYDIYDIAGTSMLIAIKAESEKTKKIRDVMNVVHHTLNRGAPMMIVGDETYQMYKQGLISHELVMLRMIKFNTELDNPHKYLTHYLQAINFWKGFEAFVNKYPKFMQTAWSCMQDFFHHPDCVKFSGKAIAVAAIDLAADFHDIDLTSPNAKHRTWQNVFNDDFYEEENIEIKTKMLETYDLEEEVLSKYRYGSAPTTAAVSGRNYQPSIKNAPIPVPPPAPIIGTGSHQHRSTSGSMTPGRSHSSGGSMTPGRAPPPPRISRFN